jgi:hypothetical protein
VLIMAIPKGHRFEVLYNVAFPRGLVLVGEIGPDNEYQSREDRAAGRPVRQRIDDVTGKRQWKGTFTDPDESNSKRASFDITFLADVQPVPTTEEALPGMRAVEGLDGLTAEPRLAGNGEFKYQSYVYRSTGFSAAGSATGAGSGSGAARSVSAGKAAREAGGEASGKAA